MNSTPSSSALLQSKPHLEILDGLRGLAAVVVVVFHFMEIIIPDYHDDFIAHGYLAVDFFFCLSGFVIAYAYDTRISQIGLLTFFKLRLIRLHPLVIIGAFIGLLLFILDPFSKLYAVYGAGKSWLMFITACFMIPYPIVPERYFNNFHLNPPTWSLFWEYIANIFYAVILFRLPNKLLWALTLLAAALLCYTAYHYTNLSVGWSGDNIWGGGSRVFYSFLAGMLVYRSQWVINTKLGFGALSLLLLAAFMFPYSDKFNWLTEPFLVIVYFPFLVALGAGARPAASVVGLCKISGDISYPLYMVHYPFIWIFFSYVQSSKPSVPHMLLIMIIGTVALLLFAYLVMTFVDIPVRRYLKQRLDKRYAS